MGNFPRKVEEIGSLFVAGTVVRIYLRLLICYLMPNLLHSFLAIKLKPQWNYILLSINRKRRFTCAS